MGVHRVYQRTGAPSTPIAQLIHRTMGTSRPSNVIVVSIDGLRPEFYLGDSFEAPTLKRIATEGAYSTGVLSVYPSLTYPSHTSLVTGVRPIIHGIPSNTRFSLTKGASHEWYWEAQAIQVPTLWQVARARGKTTALIRWPVTVGADVEWLIPEIFSTEPGTKSNLELAIEYSTPGIIDEIFGEVSFLKDTAEKDHCYEWHDQWVGAASNHILTKYRPNLMLVHLIQVDKAQHDWGRDSIQTKKAVKNVDSIINCILKEINLNKDLLFIVGDHGFLNYNKRVHVNQLFVKKGWITINSGQLKDWKVIVHVDGGQGGVYLREPQIKEEVLLALKQNAGGLYCVYGREKLDKLGAFPGAVCSIDPLGTCSIGSRLTGDWVSSTEREKGQHGGHPEHPGLETGFVVVGANVRSGQKLGEMSILDIAPTIAKLLKIEFRNTEGKALNISLRSK